MNRLRKLTIFARRRAHAPQGFLGEGFMKFLITAIKVISAFYAAMFLLAFVFMAVTTLFPPA